MKIRGALQTPDGSWRVEIIQESGRAGYRILHNGVALQGIPKLIGIGEVQFYLRSAGVDMADLVEAPVERAA